MAHDGVNEPPGTYTPTLRVWPHVPEAWVLARGDGWVALAKPAFASELGTAQTSDSPSDGGQIAGVAERWSRATAQRGARCDWHEVFAPIAAGKRERAHGALSSGVVVLGDEQTATTLRKTRKAGLSAAWVVGLVGWPVLDARAAAGLERGLLADGFQCRTVRHRGDRVLLELRAGTDDVSVVGALASLGFSIEGAPTDRQPPSEHARMLLHRSLLSWPGTRLEAALPDDMVEWLDSGSSSLGDRIAAALQRRYDLAWDRTTDCFRLYDDETDVTVDLYGADLVWSAYTDLPSDRDPGDALPRLLAAEAARATAIAQQLGARTAWLKLRPRQANTIVDALRAGLVPTAPIFGDRTQPREGVVIRENGVRYWAHLGAGLSTGLFLDQRDNRRWVQSLAAGKRVLNTFAYTCGFSVAAAVGGARRTVSIDAARPALEQGRANLALNGFDDPEQHDTIRGDVFNWIPRLARRGDRFDIVILDPPSYSKVRRRRFSALKDYAELVAQTAPVLDDGGWLLACVNHTKMTRRGLHQAVLEGCKRAKRQVLEVEHRDPCVDHPTGRMKSIAVRLN